MGSELEHVGIAHMRSELTRFRFGIPGLVLQMSTDSEPANPEVRSPRPDRNHAIRSPFTVPTSYLPVRSSSRPTDMSSIRTDRCCRCDTDWRRRCRLPQEASTSLASSVEPSWNLTPSRSVQVQTVASSLPSQPWPVRGVYRRNPVRTGAAFRRPAGTDAGIRRRSRQCSRG